MWLNILLLLVLGLVFVPASILLLGISRWQGATSRQRARLESERGQIRPTTYDDCELDGLPTPVQNYFRAVLNTGQPIVAMAELRHEGELDLEAFKRSWAPAFATQTVVTQRPGFSWDARVTLAPGVKLFVHDAYVAGEGMLHAALIGLFKVTRSPSSPELAHAELMRFLAEATLYPTKLLPSQGTRWEPIDAHSARATLSDAHLSVSLLFEFADTGLISTVRTDGRYRASDTGQASAEGMARVPWEVRVSRYEQRGGMRIPTMSEAAWILPEGRRPYWRGRVTDVLYKFSG